MSFRVSALVAVVGVLALGSVAPAFGQPVAPQRPRTSPFGAIFSPPLAQQQLPEVGVIRGGPFAMHGAPRRGQGGKKRREDTAQKAGEKRRTGRQHGACYKFHDTPAM